MTVATGWIRTHSYVYLLRTAEWIAKQPVDENRPDSAESKKIAYCTFMAMCLEAFLNNCGHYLVPWWSDEIEKQLGIEAKLSVIFEKCGVTFDPGVRPYQTIRSLMNFRNKIAHAKTERAEADFKELLNLERSRKPMPRIAKWQKSLDNLSEEHVREDIDKFMLKLWEEGQLENIMESEPNARPVNFPVHD